MKKIKITTIILAIILISLVAFGGVYTKTQNRYENKVKDYFLGRELSGERIIELKIANEESEEGENTQNTENLTVENYETVKNTIENRMNNLGAEDYTVSLNKEDGTIRVELPEDSNTDDLAYYLIASRKVELKEKDSNTELLGDSMVKKAQYTYKTTSDGAYQIYLELLLTKEGQAKIDEIKNTYAILESEVDEIETAESSNDENSEIEGSTEETDADNSENVEDTEITTEEAKKIAKLSIAETEYDIEKIEKNKITVKMGSQTSNNTSVNNNMAKAAELAMLINSGEYPVEYEVQNNRFTYSDISMEQLSYFALAIAVILVVIFIVLTVKYKMKGLLSSLSCIGFVAIFSLVLRYTNVNISIEGIGAIILVILINLKLNQMILSKTKNINFVDEATISSYKDIFLKLVPIMIITLVFCFSGWSNLSSFGMIMFWGFVLIAIYNVIITKTLLKLSENK